MINDMKKILLFLFCCLSIVLVSCDGNSPVMKKVVTGDATNITDYSAQLHGKLNVDPDGYASFYCGILIAKTQEELKELKGKYYQSSHIQDKAFHVNVYGLTPNTRYYYCTWVAMTRIENKSFGKISAFTTLDGTGIPEGEAHPNTNYVAKPFSVSSKKQVYFSPGNLQYQPNATTWRFASQQMDYLGSANRNTALTYDGWIDLFGWSTEEGFSYFGVSTDTAANYYSGTFKDWGCKRIGKDEANTWRSLSLDEWTYVLTKRKNCHELVGCALVMGVKGLILLPDDWQCPEGVTFKWGFYPSDDKAGYGAHQNIDDIEWPLLEHAGAVFLPAAGYRTGLDVGNVQVDAFYWTSTANDADKAYYMYFNASGVDCKTWWRHHAYSVRLVRDL